MRRQKRQRKPGCKRGCKRRANGGTSGRIEAAASPCTQFRVGQSYRLAAADRVAGDPPGLHEPGSQLLHVHPRLETAPQHLDDSPHGRPAACRRPLHGCRVGAVARPRHSAGARPHAVSPRARQHVLRSRAGRRDRRSPDSRALRPRPGAAGSGGGKLGEAHQLLARRKGKCRVGQNGPWPPAVSSP